jgi:hypothetical protein
MECINILGCKSFAFLTTTDINNCHLSSGDEGLRTATESVVYKKDGLKAIRVGI